jgi:type IV pilus assembly protein PilM
VLFGGGRKSSEGPIGVDIGDHTIRMIQLMRDGDKRAAVAAAARPLGVGISSKSGEAYHQAVSDAVRDMLSTGRFNGHRAVSCLPAASLIYKNIRLPKMPYDELASAVQWEASERLKFSGDAMNVQFFDAGEVLQGQDKRQEVILLAASKRFVDEHIRSLRVCDLELCAIEAVPSALARCIEYANTVDEQDPPVRVVIDVGYNGTKVLVIQGSRICFFKLIEIGGRHMDESLASKLELPTSAAAEARRDWMSGGSLDQGDARITAAMGPVVEELSREIGLCLRYYSVTFRGRRPEEAWVVGGESGNAWLWARLCEDVGLKPSANDPLASLDLTAVRSEVGGPDQWAGWGVAVGLSLRHTDVIKRKRREAA